MVKPYRYFYVKSHKFPQMKQHILVICNYYDISPIEAVKSVEKYMFYGKLSKADLYVSAYADTVEEMSPMEIRNYNYGFRKIIEEAISEEIKKERKQKIINFLHKFCRKEGVNYES